MNFNNHLELKGKHAFLSPSKYTWINYDLDKLIFSYKRERNTEVGTALHDAASVLINNKIKLNKKDTHLLQFVLKERGLPIYIDINMALENLSAFVNDAIGYRMLSEQPLKYSDVAFGTVDAISFNEKEQMLRIHDLKTGTTPAHMEQLYCYAALFCLEYKIKPIDIHTELRIYQNGEILYAEPEVDEIVPIMDKIVTYNNIILTMKDEEI